MPAPAVLHVWRHPRPRAVASRCIGRRTDVPVDPRRAKRLAHRIRQHARRHGLTQKVWTSPLRRCADVGRWLARWGWRHRVDTRLCELDFGDWDGQSWHTIDRSAVDAWCADFAHHAPGGGESVVQLFARCRAFLADVQDSGETCVVGHGGWMNAMALIAAGGSAPHRAADWPAPPGYATFRTSVLPKSQ
jgi:alpha-ribazole phosphatase